MNTGMLERLDAEIQHLSLSEQVWLMERLVHAIRVKTTRQEQLLESDLAAMAADPDIQREIAAIDAEFSVTENDGLTDES